MELTFLLDYEILVNSFTFSSTKQIFLNYKLFIIIYLILFLLNLVNDGLVVL
jgi:hypothetical protein